MPNYTPRFVVRDGSYTSWEPTLLGFSITQSFCAGGRGELTKEDIFYNWNRTEEPAPRGDAHRGRGERVLNVGAALPSERHQRTGLVRSGRWSNAEESAFGMKKGNRGHGGRV